MQQVNRLWLTICTTYFLGFSYSLRFHPSPLFSHHHHVHHPRHYSRHTSSCYAARGGGGQQQGEEEVRGSHYLRKIVAALGLSATLFYSSPPLPWTSTTSSLTSAHATTTTPPPATQQSLLQGSGGGGGRYPLFQEGWQLVADNFYDPSFQLDDWNHLYLTSLDKLSHRGSGSVAEVEEVEVEVLQEAISSLHDKYTRWLTPSQYESLYKFDAIGVGILFQSTNDRLNDKTTSTTTSTTTTTNDRLVVAAPPIIGSSGQLAGIKKGDIVYSVNGKSTKEINAIQLLEDMSNDVQPTLTLEIGPPLSQEEEEVGSGSGSGSSSHRVVVLQRALEKANNPVTFHIVTLPSLTTTTSTTTRPNKKIGLIQLEEFNQLAPQAVKDSLEKCLTEQVDEVVLDLRGNTGGGFQFALNIGGLFLGDHVPMVSVHGRSQESSQDTVFYSSIPSSSTTTTSSSSSLPLYPKPIVILVDGLTASASEVLTAALRDQCHAITIGSQTFGKGKIQGVFGLSNGAGMTITVAQYVSPRGTVIQGQGVPADLPLVTQQSAVLNMVLKAIGINTLPVSTIDWQAVHQLEQQCQPPAVLSSTTSQQQ
eukprot:scaffold3849_cov264-Ochromonas_danica.AAC.8